jgi:hypothetical protein
VECNALVIPHTSVKFGDGNVHLKKEKIPEISVCVLLFFPDMYTSQYFKKKSSEQIYNVQMIEGIEYGRMLQQQDYIHLFSKTIATNASILKKRPYMNRIKIQSL